MRGSVRLGRFGGRCVCHAWGGLRRISRRFGPQAGGDAAAGHRRGLRVGQFGGGAGHGGGTARAKTFTTYVAGDGAVCGGWERRGSGWIGGRHAGVAWCFVFDLTSDSFQR